MTEKQNIDDYDSRDIIDVLDQKYEFWIVFVNYDMYTFDIGRICLSTKVRGGIWILKLSLTSNG